MKPGLTPYDVLSQIKQWTQQVGTNQPTIQNFEYDYEGQVVNDVVTPQGQPAVKAYTYGYDAAGNRTSEEVDVSPVATVTRSSYNGVNQLTSRTGSGTLPVRFQGTINKPGTVSVNSQAASISTNPANAGGRIFTTTNLLLMAGSQTSSITAYDLNTNMAVKNYTLTVVGGTNKTFAYDNNGNCTNMSTLGTNTVYQWDAENRLVVISIYVTNSGTTNRSEFTYDGFGRRVQAVEKNNGTVTSTKRFVWAGLELAQERAANNSVTKRFFGGGEQIGGTNYYFTRDHLGSVREMTDSSGTVRARYDYDPYGRQTKLAGDLDADFGFTGHYVHAPSGLYLTLFRAYNADSGRWLNRDPIEEAGGINLYGYVGNNTINAIDPLGTTLVVSSTPFPGQNPNDYGPFTINFPDGSSKIKYLRQLTLTQIGNLVSSANYTLHCKKHSATDRADEKSFDTSIYGGLDPDKREYYEYENKIYADNEINYIGIGIYEAWMGDKQSDADLLTIGWKYVEYSEYPSVGTFYWLHYGYKNYK